MRFRDLAQDIRADRDIENGYRKTLSSRALRPLRIRGVLSDIFTEELESSLCASNMMFRIKIRNCPCENLFRRIGHFSGPFGESFIDAGMEL